MRLEEVNARVASGLSPSSRAPIRSGGARAEDPPPMAIAAYTGLLCVWVLFVPPAVRARRGGRSWAVAAAALGLLAALRETWMTFVWGPSAIGPIRLDIPLVAALLCGVYLPASLRLWAGGWRWTAAVAGVLTLAGGGGMAAAWVGATREAERLTRLFHAGNRMLFEAKFRNAAAYDRFFEMSGAGDHPMAGHWQATEAGPVTRLVINPAGQAFLFHGCGDSECQFGPGTALTRDGTGWRVRLVERGVGERTLRIEPAAGGGLSGEVDGRPIAMRRATPPLLGVSPPEQLDYLGAFAAVEPVRQHARVSQLWLWRDGDDLLALGAFQVLVAGRRADFVLPIVLGRGRHEGEDGEGWRFRWSDGRAERELFLRPAGAGFEAIPAAADPQWPAGTLAPRELFHDEVIELAPRTGAEQWQAWFDTLLVGHFFSGEIPAP